MSPHRQDQTPATRAQKAKVISEIATKTLGALIVLGMVAAIVVLVIRQNVNSKKTDHTLEVLHILVDCTTTGHTCYEMEQARTAAAVAVLNRLDRRNAALAAGCAPNYVQLPLPQRIHAIEACIKRREH